MGLSLKISDERRSTTQEISAVRHGLPKSRQGRKRMDDVANASKFYDQNSHSV